MPIESFATCFEHSGPADASLRNVVVTDAATRFRRRSSWSSRDAAMTVGPRIRGTSRRPRTTEADWRRRDLPSRTSRSFLVQRLCLVTCPAFWRLSPVVLRLHYRMVTARHTLTMYVIG